MNLIKHIQRQRDWNIKTFGPAFTVAGTLKHIRKELEEIERNPDDLMEWVDVIHLALQGAFRQGYTPEQIAFGIVDKQLINESRVWPDWRTVKHGEPIEHARRFLVERPNGVGFEFDRENEARAYWHECPSGTRFVDRRFWDPTAVPIASIIHPSLGEGDEA